MSIQKRLVGSYLAVIMITVGLLEVVLITSVNYYYHHNVEESITNQAEISANFFKNYFSDTKLSEQADHLLRGFAQNTSAQVQIIDASGSLLEDSNKNKPHRSMLGYPDVKEALNGGVGRWKGSDPALHAPDDTMLAIAYPLFSADEIVGAVRYITSLTPVIATIRYIAAWFIGAGLLILALVAVLGMILSRTITGPIRELTAAADEMGEGNLSVRTSKRYQDELGTLADTLNTMASRLEQHEALKNDFISSISHEIRTPLTNIHGWVITLKSDPAKDESLWSEGLDIIDAESIRLTHLVDELLDFSKLENGRIQLALTKVELPKLLQQIITQLMPRASRLGLDLRIEMDPALPPLNIDENRMKQVLINVLDNAFKFSRPNGLVSLRAAQHDHEIHMTVQDNGQGIKASDLPHITQKFYHGNEQSSGSGLGLAICQEIMKLHQGSLEIESEWGEGTTVRLRIPLTHHER